MNCGAAESWARHDRQLSRAPRTMIDIGCFACTHPTIARATTSFGSPRGLCRRGCGNRVTITPPMCGAAQTAAADCDYLSRNPDTRVIISGCGKGRESMSSLIGALVVVILVIVILAII